MALPFSKKKKFGDHGDDDHGHGHHGHQRQGPMIIAPVPESVRDGQVPDRWEVALDGIQFVIIRQEGEYGDLGDKRIVTAYRNQWAGGKQIGGSLFVASLDDALVACWNFDFNHPWP